MKLKLNILLLALMGTSIVPSRPRMFLPKVASHRFIQPGRDPDSEWGQTRRQCIDGRPSKPAVWQQGACHQYQERSVGGRHDYRPRSVRAGRVIDLTPAAAHALSALTVLLVTCRLADKPRKANLKCPVEGSPESALQIHHRCYWGSGASVNCAGPMVHRWGRSYAGPIGSNPDFSASLRLFRQSKRP